MRSREGAEGGGDGQDREKEKERVGVAGLDWVFGRPEPKGCHGDLHQQQEAWGGGFLGPTLCPQS